MSKYVRTKDHIYDLDAKGIRECIPIEDRKKVKVLQTVLSNGKPLYDTLDVLKESDAIKELCDERVLTRYFEETKYLHHEILPETQWDMMAKSVAARLSNGLTDFNYYGAIWTDKGLVYVAKINEKGELVLL